MIRPADANEVVEAKEVRYHSEPQASFGKRLKSSVLSVLPIEGLL